METREGSNKNTGLKAASIAGLASFPVLYASNFIPAARAGISMKEWLLVLGSGEAPAFALFFKGLADRGSDTAFAWLLVLETLSSIAFGVGFTSFLLLLRSRSQSSNRPRARMHGLVASFAFLCALLDVAGTAALLVTFISGGRMPPWAAMFSTAAYYARLPFCYIVLIWVFAIFILYLAERFLHRGRGSLKSPEKPVP